MVMMDDSYQVGFTNCVDCKEVVFTSQVSEWQRLDIRSVRIFFVCEFCGSDGMLVLDARIWAAYLADTWLEDVVGEFAAQLEDVRTLEDLGAV